MINSEYNIDIHCVNYRTNMACWWGYQNHSVNWIH